MDIKKWVQDSACVGYSSLANSVSAASAGLGYISQWVGSLRIFGSTRINYNACKTHDERHYFLIPDNTSEDGYALSIVRCLPEGVPAVNELPKLRVIHLPNEHAEPMLRSLLVEQAKLDELAKPKLGTTVSDRLGEIADKIDELDGKIFGGVLLIGGLVAVFNPLLGAAIAAKSLIPSLGLFASKHGLKWAEESLNQSEVNKRVKQAEKDVLVQFSGAETTQVISPVLAILSKALVTHEGDFDPMLAMHELLRSDLSDLDRHHMQLASSAILDIYADNQSSKSVQAKRLSPEDQRFIELLRQIAASKS